MDHDLSGYAIVIFCLLLALLTAGYATAEVRDDTIGEVILLSGTAPAYDMIYLFMTGPEVPQYGSRMDNSNLPVVTGDPDTFTQVPVEGGSWSYSWQTGRVSGGLAPGLYIIYAATAPAAEDDLSGIPYSTTEIFLSRPVTTGTLLIRSDPPGAEVDVNGKYSGNTPLDLPGLAPGDYRITLSLQGYVPATELYNLSAGETRQISAELEPEISPTPSVTMTVTTHASDTETTVPPSPTPAPLSPVLLIAGLGTGLAVTCWRFRR